MAVSSTSRIVIKYGGSALEQHEAAAAFAATVANTVKNGSEIIVVHGGGKELTSWMNRIGLTARFIDGLRYTDEPSLEIAEMVLSAKANKYLAGLITSQGVPAVGISARDGDLCVAAPVNAPSGEPLGLVGELVRTNPQLLITLCAEGYVPVVSPIASNGAGGALNCNADHIAAELALATKCRTLVLLTDVDGIRCDGKLLATLTLSEGRALLSHKDVSGGMRPKIAYALRALEGGVKRVSIVNAGSPQATARALAGADCGTTIVAS